MASTSLPQADSPSPDKGGLAVPQEHGVLWTLGGPKRGRLRVRTLVFLRWLAVAGQSFTVLFVGLVLRLPVPFALCFTLIALLAWVNLLVSLSSTGQRIADDWEATLQIAFDIVQMAAMFYMTGGVVNPFSMLIIAPVVLAAATLPLRNVIGLALLASLATIVIAVWSLPLPGPDPVPFVPPLLNRVGAVIARLLGIFFTAGYAWQAAAEAARPSRFAPPRTDSHRTPGTISPSSSPSCSA